MEAIHQAGTPALPPVNIAVSLPPAHSAAIKAQPQYPNSVIVKQSLGSGSEISNE